MRTTRVCWSLLVLPLIACGGGDAEQDTGGEAATASAEPAVDPAQAATISGVVRFTGTAPAEEAIDMSAEPTCAEKHSEPPTQHAVAVGGDGGLGNVFVYVKEGLPDRSWPASNEEVVLDQDGCVYEPHVLGVRAGEEFTVRNSDGLLHNVNAQPQANRGFNMGQPTNMEGQRSFAQQEVMIPVTCEVHGWMNAYIGVVDHPFFAVTGEDGSFRLEGLPPGTYTVEAWHERFGTQTMQVTVAAQETGTADFTYDGSQVAFVPLGEPVDLHTHH
jgi:plastocyanin